LVKVTLHSTLVNLTCFNSFFTKLWSFVNHHHWSIHKHEGNSKQA